MKVKQQRPQDTVMSDLFPMRSRIGLAQASEQLWLDNGLLMVSKVCERENEERLQTELGDCGVKGKRWAFPRRLCSPTCAVHSESV